VEFLFGDQDAHQHAGLAQQALEALMRARFPTVSLAAAIGLGARGLQSDQHLPGRVLAEALDRPVWKERRVVLRNGKGEVVGQRGPARCAGDESCVPAEDLGEQPPRLGQRSTFLGEAGGEGRAVGSSLPLRDEAALLDNRRREDQPGGPDQVEPFEVGIAVDRLDIGGHGAHPVTGQR
jgi:hypothetical protein